MSTCFIYIYLGFNLKWSSPGFPDPTVRSTVLVCIHTSSLCSLLNCFFSFLTEFPSLAQGIPEGIYRRKRIYQPRPLTVSEGLGR